MSLLKKSTIAPPTERERVLSDFSRLWVTGRLGISESRVRARTESCIICKNGTVYLSGRQGHLLVEEKQSCSVSGGKSSAAGSLY